MNRASACLVFSAAGLSCRLLFALALGLAPALAFEQELDEAEIETLDKAVHAYRIGDYEPALELLRPLAEEGIAEAQFTLGFMHAGGLGVPQDYRAAAEWYEQAARQGHPQAQNYLGLLYFEGNGVAKSFREAFIFFELAAAAGNQDAANNRLIVARKMTSAQITEAQKEAGQMIALFKSTVERVVLPRRTASGVVVTRDGHILTHVQAVQDCRELTVRGAGEEPREARLVLADRFTGLALIASANAGRAVPLRGLVLAEGEAVIIRGYALNESKVPVAEATAAAVRADPALYRVDRRLVQLDRVVGASYLGAPVFDAGGRLAAIMVPGTEPAEVANLRAAPGPVGFAIRREIAELLLQLNGYAYDVDTTDKPPPNAESRMRQATVAIECWWEEEP
jgi:S1-C subfamily serine protease